MPIGHSSTSDDRELESMRAEASQVFLFLKGHFSDNMEHALSGDDCVGLGQEIPMSIGFHAIGALQQEP